MAACVRSASRTGRRRAFDAAVEVFCTGALLTGWLIGAMEAGAPPMKARASCFRRLRGHSIHRIERNIRVRVGGTSAHFGSDPDGLHHFLLGGPLLDRELRMAANAVRALGDMRDCNG